MFSKNLLKIYIIGSTKIPIYLFLLFALCTTIYLETPSFSIVQGNYICGWVVKPTEAFGTGGGGTPYITVSETNQKAGIRPTDFNNMLQFDSIQLPGFVRIYNPVYISTDMIRGFSQIKRVISCEPPTIEPPITIHPTRIPMPTWIPIAAWHTPIPLTNSHTSNPTPDN
jgi:hypothetical protein